MEKEKMSLEKLNLHNKNKIEAEIEKGGKIAKHINNLLKQINSIELLSGSKEDKKILQEQKSRALYWIRTVLDNAKDYSDTIKTFSSIENMRYRYDPEKLILALENADKRRKLSHNVLISNINICNRYIREHFGVMDEVFIDKFEEKEEVAGRSVLDINRVNFSDNIICLDNVNLEDRDSIATWAENTSKIADLILEEIKK